MLAGDIVLRPLSERTLEFVRQVRSNPRIYRWLREQKPVTVEEQRSWFNKYLKQSGHHVYVGSFQSILFGYGQLRQHKGVCEAEIGLCVSYYSQGKGLGETLLRATVAKAWELGLNKLQAFILSDNIRSIKLFEKCGFEPSEDPAIWILERAIRL